MVQIPHGPEDRWCPFWKKKMSTVCHTCPLWVQVRGVDSNTGQNVDRWDCSIGLLTMLQLETAKEVRQTNASVDKMRADNQTYHGENKQLAALSLNGRYIQKREIVDNSVHQRKLLLEGDSNE